jgi:2-oxoglutarate ferredoxin oxidoreductase subunit beta
MNRLPHIWCAGCGNGQVVGAMLRAIDQLQMDPSRLLVMGGVGCSGRAAQYLNFDTLHTLHGRTFAFATGIRMAKPDLNIITIVGDGDCAAIGGNHFIHAARRNIDLTALVINNKTYGMTGGQSSPTTPVEALATTAPYGNAETEFDLCAVALAAGASFVARAATVRIPELTGIIVKAIQHRGFSFVEVITQCPTYFGRPNKQGGAVEMLQRQKEITVTLASAKARPEDAKGKLVTGVLFESDRPTFEARYAEIRSRAALREKEA